MKKIVFYLFILMNGLAPLYANQILQVPFDSVFINPNDTITAPYSFGPHGIIFCYTNSNNFPIYATISWTFNGNRIQATLPIFLTTNTSFQGSLADANGTIIIQNINTISEPISCLFGY